MTNVDCATSFMCLLVELHIHACLTYQILKMLWKDQAHFSKTSKPRVLAWRQVLPELFLFIFESTMKVGFQSNMHLT